MSAREKAVEIYLKHIDLARTDGRAFRRKVMDELMAATGCSQPAAATHYNNAKLLHPVDGLGRAPARAGVRKMAGRSSKKEDIVPDDECYTVLELIPQGSGHSVGRCQSFLYQGEAGETFEGKVEAWPGNVWVMIQGLGPNSGDDYRLDTGERELRRYTPKNS